MGLTTPYLRDNASSSYWALFYANNHSHLSWERFQEEMIRLFDNTNARNEILMTKMLEDVHSVYHGPATLDEYILAFRNIEIQVPDLPFCFKFFHFKRPLPASLKSSITREDVYQQASMYYVYQLAHEWAAGKTRSSDPPPRHHRNKHKHKHDKPNKGKEKDIRRPLLMLPPEKEMEEDALDVLDVTKAKCYNCGQIGHISKDCKACRRKRVTYKGRKYFLLDAKASDSNTE